MAQRRVSKRRRHCDSNVVVLVIQNYNARLFRSSPVKVAFTPVTGLVASLTESIIVLKDWRGLYDTVKLKTSIFYVTLRSSISTTSSATSTPSGNHWTSSSANKLSKVYFDNE